MCSPSNYQRLFAIRANKLQLTALTLKNIFSVCCPCLWSGNDVRQPTLSCKEIWLVHQVIIKIINLPDIATQLSELLGWPLISQMSSAHCHMYVILGHINYVSVTYWMEITNGLIGQSKIKLNVGISFMSAGVRVHEHWWSN